MLQSRTLTAVALLLACLRAPGAAVTVSLPAGAYDIVREAPEGLQRLVYLNVGNPGAAALEGLTLVCRCAGGDVRREMLPVPPGGAWDTVWLPEPLPENVPAELLQGGARVWEGELRRPAEARATRPALPMALPGSLLGRSVGGWVGGQAWGWMAGWRVEAGHHGTRSSG